MTKLYKLLALAILIVSTQMSYASFRDVCMKERATICPEVMSKGQLIVCLQDNEEKLSKGCSNSLNKTKKQILSKNPCFLDGQMLCPGLLKKGKINPRAVFSCLMEQKQKVSAMCAEKLDNDYAKLKKMNPCNDSIEKHCKDVKMSEVNSCLDKNKEKLENKCTVHIAKVKKRIPCYSEIHKFCVGKKGASLEACLMKNEANASAQCLSHLNKVKEKKPCLYDWQKFCSHVNAGGGALISCLQQNQNKLQPMCVTSISKVKEAHPCAEDVRKHCSDQKMRIGQCLEGKVEKLSKSCKQKVQKVVANREAVQKDCGGEVKNLCNFRNPRQGGVLHCLASKWSKLGSTCRKNAAIIRVKKKTKTL